MTDNERLEQAGIDLEHYKEIAIHVCNQLHGRKEKELASVMSVLAQSLARTERLVDGREDYSGFE